MKILISGRLAGIIAGLLLNIELFTNKLLLWKDTAEHVAISKTAWFILFTVVLYVVLHKYVGGIYNSGGVKGAIRYGVLGISTCLLLVAYAVQILGIGVLIHLPKGLLTFVTAWYAVPAAIAIHFIVLFFMHRN